MSTEEAADDYEGRKVTYARLWHPVLLDPGLSMGAKITYAALMYFAGRKNSCFPGQKRLALVLTSTGRRPVSERTVQGYLQELRETALVTWERRGLGQTNLYRLADVRAVYSEEDVKTLKGYMKWQPDEAADMS